MTSNPVSRLKKAMSSPYQLRGTGDLVYRRSDRAEPYFVYLLLSGLNFLVPFRVLPIVATIFRGIGLRARFRVLDRTIRLYPHANIGDSRYHGGLAHESRISESIVRLAPTGGVIYDIGSSVGWYSVLLAPQSSRVLAFDPFDSAVVPNARLNGATNVEYFPWFIADAVSGEGRTSLDELVFSRGFPAPDMIKMDVEGGEADILRGAARLLHETPPSVVAIETHSKQLFDECVKLLGTHGYTVIHLGCPKVNIGSDIYPLRYELTFPDAASESETRIIVGVQDRRV